MPAADLLSPVESTLAITLFAAYADGDRCEPERIRIERIAGELGWDQLSAISRRILMGKLSLKDAAAGLVKPEDREAAYESARVVCEVDGDLSPDETAFLEELRGLLALDHGISRVLDEEADALALAPLAPAPRETPPPLPATVPDQGGTILRYAILNGALELLPENARDPGHRAAADEDGPRHRQGPRSRSRPGQHQGIPRHRRTRTRLADARGLRPQVDRRPWKKVGGKKAGKFANQLTGSAFSFASTWAIGHLAVNYYAGGRRFGAAEMKAVYEPLLAKAKELHPRYLAEIQEQAKSLNPAAILEYVRGGRAM